VTLMLVWDGQPGDGPGGTADMAALAQARGVKVVPAIDPTKLYQTYQRFADQPTTLDLRALDVGQPYWVAVEAFDESGVSALTPVIPIR